MSNKQSRLIPQHYNVLTVYKHLDNNNARLANVGYPIADNDAATKLYVDDHIVTSSLIGGTGISITNGSVNVLSSQTHITEIGTINTGTWSANTINVPYGGSGKNTFTANKIVIGNGTNPLISVDNLDYNTTTNILTLTGILNINNTINSVGINSGGALTILGGTSITKDVYIGGNTSITENNTIGGNLVVNGSNTIGGNIIVNGNINVSNITTGNIFINGGLTLPLINSENAIHTNITTTNIKTTNISCGQFVASLGITTGQFVATNMTTNNLLSITTNTLLINSTNGNFTRTTMNNTIITNSTITNLLSTNSSISNLYTAILNTTNITSSNIIINGLNSTLNLVGTSNTLTNIINGNITSNSLNVSSITSNSILTTNLNASNITTTNINVASLTVSNLNAPGITSTNINVTNITNSNLNNISIITTNITSTNLNISNIISTNLNSTNITSTNLNTSNITSTNLNTSNITSTNLNNSNITTGNLNATNITSTNLNNSNITTGNLNTTNITSTNLNVSNIITNGITTSNIITNGITTTNIITNGITTTNINNTNISTGSLRGINIINNNNSVSNLYGINNNLTYITSGGIYVNNISNGTLNTNIAIINSTINVISSIGTLYNTNSSIANAYINNISSNNILNSVISTSNIYTSNNNITNKKIIAGSDYNGSSGTILNIISNIFTDTVSNASSSNVILTSNIISPQTIIATNNVITEKATSLYIQGKPIAGTNNTFNYNSALSIGYVDNNTGGYLSGQIMFERNDGNWYSSIYNENATNKLVIANASLSGGGGVGIYTYDNTPITLSHIVSATNITPTPFISFNKITNFYSTEESIDTSSGSVIFSGGVGISKSLFVNTIAKNSGTFDIQHPLIENKRLVHSFIEGPRCDLIYRGTTQLINGIGIVNLDEECVAEDDCKMTLGTFEVLCINPQCFLQTTTVFSQLIGNISGGNLNITANEPINDIINWMVIAERKDIFIKKWERTNVNGYLKTEY